MADLGTQALGAVFEPIKDRMKKVPVPVVTALLVAYFLPWARIRLACYSVALEHPGALFYALLSSVVLSVFLVTALISWRRERVKRHSAVKRAAAGAGKSAICPDPAHSMTELALYEKMPHGRALWDVKLLGHAGSRPEVHDIRILGQAAYCATCKNTVLVFHLSMTAENWWSCATCRARIPLAELLDHTHRSVMALAFARFKKDNPTAINNRG